MRLGKGSEDMFRYVFLFLPFEGVLCKMLCYELPASFLPFLQLGSVVWGGKAAEVGRFAEWDWRRARHCVQSVGECQ